MNSSRFSVHIAGQCRRWDAVSDSAASSIRFAHPHPHEGANAQPSGTAQGLPKAEEMGNKDKSGAGTGGANAGRRWAAPSLASVVSATLAGRCAWFDHSAESLDLLDVVCERYFSTNSSGRLFSLQQLFDADGTRCKRALCAYHLHMHYAVLNACRRVQSKQGPGSVLRPGAMSECPAISMPG